LGGAAFCAAQEVHDLSIRRSQGAVHFSCPRLFSYLGQPLINIILYLSLK
jgi:hypothetical protein